jgi:uncharacterized protein (TIGR00725 family)
MAPHGVLRTPRHATQHRGQMRMMLCVLPESIVQTPSIKIGVMGSSSTSIAAEGLHRVDDLAQRLGKKIAAASCVLITGELDGIPGRVVEAHRQHGGLSVGISPAHSATEHAALYGPTPSPSTVVIYSGFGFKGRNVIAIRSADIVLLFSGGIGTLNEFTIAYDEGKVIGLLQGTGGVADVAQTLLDTLSVRSTGAAVIADPDPEALVERCLARLCEQRGEQDRALRNGIPFEQAGDRRLEE